MKIRTITNKLNSQEFGQLYSLTFSNGGRLDLISCEDEDNAKLEVVHEMNPKDSDIAKGINLEQLIQDLEALRFMLSRNNFKGDIMINNEVHERGFILTYSLEIGLPRVDQEIHKSKLYRTK